MKQIAISKQDENQFIVLVDENVPLNSPIRSEYFVFTVDNRANIDEIIHEAKTKRAQLLSKYEDMAAKPLY